MNKEILKNDRDIGHTTTASKSLRYNSLEPFRSAMYTYVKAQRRSNVSQIKFHDVFYDIIRHSIDLRPIVDRYQSRHGLVPNDTDFSLKQIW